MARISNREKCKRYYYRHRDEILQHQREYYVFHREEVRKRTSEYRGRHPLTNVFIGMMKRCGHFAGADEKKLQSYAKRGISVCDEWRSFPAFEKWAIENGWREGLQLDRIDNARGYSPDNCRFVTPQENGWNKRNNHIVIYKGEMMALSKAYYLSGSKIKLSTVMTRIRKGWSFHDSIMTPAHGRKGAAKQAARPEESEATSSSVPTHSCGDESAKSPPPSVPQEAQPSPEAINVRDLVQAEFNF